MDRFMALGEGSFVSTGSQRPQGRVGESRPRGPLLSMTRCGWFLCDGWQTEAELHFEAEAGRVGRNNHLATSWETAAGGDEKAQMLGGPARCPVCVQGQMAQSTPLPIPASYTNQERGG
jgi:hypothetical protein